VAVVQAGELNLAARRGWRTHRVWLGVLLVCAASPVRIFVPTGLTSSFSILDVVALAAFAALLVDAAVSRRLDLGPPGLLALLTLPALVNLLSTTWTQDMVATVTSAFVYVESLILYLFALRVTRGMSAGSIVAAMRLFVLLVLTPAFLLLFRVPGFGPQEMDLSPTSTDYVGYFSRLSHPFIGRSNNLATVLVFFVFIFAVWGTRHRDARALVAAGVSMTAVALTLSRGVTLALVVTGLVAFTGMRNERSREIGAHRRWRAGRIVALGALVAVAAVWALFQLNASTRDFSSGRLSGAGAAERTSRYELALDKIVQRPSLGVGAGAVPDGDPALSGGVHNAYLQQLVSYGLGLGLLTILCLIGLWWATERLDRYRLTGLSLAVLTQLLLWLTESSYEGTVLRPILYLSIGLGVALLRAEYETDSVADRAQAPAPRQGAVI